MAVAVLWPAAPVGAALTLTVSPSTGLTDGQMVMVDVSGFDASADVALTVVQCNPDPRSIEDCDVGLTEDALALEDDGTGSAPFRVHLLSSSTGSKVRCDAGRPCALAVLSDPENFTARMAVTSISFAAGQTGMTTTSSSTTPTSAQPRSVTPSSAGSSSVTTGSPSSTATTSSASPTTPAGAPATSSSASSIGPGTDGEPGAGGVSALAAPSVTSEPGTLTLPAPLSFTGVDAQVPLLGLGLALGLGGLLVQRRALRDGQR